MYKIILPVQIDGMRYGINFSRGIGETDNERIVERMKEKGFTVEQMTGQDEKSPVSDPMDEIIEGNSATVSAEFDEKTKDNEIIDYDSMSDEELAALAVEKGIDIDGMTKRKAINAIKKVVQ